MKLIVVLMILISLATPVYAADLTAPPVPESGENIMPQETLDFGEGLRELLQKALGSIRPDLKEAAVICASILGIVILLSVLQSFPGMTERVSNLAGTVAVSTILLSSTNSMVALGTKTVQELSDYGKLLLPVMTSAMAAQGHVSSSAALYAGTVFFDAVLSSLISSLLVPMVYLYLVLYTANSAVGEDLLKKMADFIKWLMSWGIKIILYIFTGFMGITGVVSGTTDAAALKAAKLTISGMVPVVGGILSDASEAVLVGAGVVKNAAGIYGILAVLAVAVSPFLKIGTHYLILKAAAAVCGIFGSRQITDLIGAFSTAMGFLLAMTASVCFLLLISTVCFLKGAF